MQRWLKKKAWNGSWIAYSVVGEWGNLLGAIHGVSIIGGKCSTKGLQIFILDDKDVLEMEVVVIGQKVDMQKEKEQFKGKVEMYYFIKVSFSY